MTEVKDLDQILVEEGYEDGQIGPSRRREKQRNPQGKTSSTARKQAIETSRLQEEGKARQIVRRDIDGLIGLATKNLGREDDHNPWVIYIKWVCQSLTEGGVVLNESDFKFLMARSSGPGGQHAQKTETSAVAIHKPTRMRAKCEDSRLAEENKRNAQFVLIERLSKHLKSWKVLVKPELGDHPNESRVRRVLGEILGSDSPSQL